MRFSVKMLLALNRCFPKIEHPFNMQNEGRQTYAEWQFAQGARTLECFLPEMTPADILAGKEVLDMGCGAAGKSLYYVSAGAKHVTGVEMVEHYRAEAEALAAKLGYSDRFHFQVGDAVRTGLPDASFDAVVMNDFMEHVSQPKEAIEEALRVLRPGGRLYITLPPYYHPTGAHLSDAIGIPWVQIWFSEQTLIDAYKELIRGVPDEADRLALRFSVGADGKEHITYINKMTLRRFRGILRDLGVTPVFYKEIPLRRYFTPLTKLPGIKELFVKMVACVIEKK